MRLLKIFKSHLALSTVLLAALCSSCITEDFDMMDQAEGGSRKLPMGKYYVLFDINDTDGTPLTTRGVGDVDTGDLEFGKDGNHEEHEIGGTGNFIIFLSGNKVIQVSELYGSHEHYPNLMPDYEEQYVEGHYISQFDVDKDYEAPETCIVVLNAGPYTNELKNCVNKSKNEIFNLIWGNDQDPTQIGRNEEGRFTMTNSIRYGEDGKLIDVVELPEDVVQDALGNFDPSKVIRVHVERMVSKATLNYKNKQGQIVPLTKDEIFGPDVEFVNMFTGFDKYGMHEYKVVKYRVRCTGWGMNGLERSGRLFKNIGTTASASDKWNDAARFRYHWAIDQHYSENEAGKAEQLPAPYPWQFRDAINKSHMDHYSDESVYGGSMDNNTLKNFSYNDFVNTNHFEKPVYFPENTFNYSLLDPQLDDRAEFLAGTHFIMTAILETAFDAPDPNNVSDADFDYPDDERTIFRDRIGNIYRTADEAYDALVVSFNYALQSQSEMKYIWYDWNGHGDGDRNWVAATGSDYAFYYKTGNDENDPNSFTEMTVANIGNKGINKQTLVPANIITGDGQRIIIDENFRILNKERLSEGKVVPVRIYHVDDWEYVKNYNRNLAKGNKEIDIEDYIDGLIAKGAKESDHRRNATPNDIQSILFNWIGPIDHFNQGRMYYFAPTRMEEVGDVYGAVRNNWYQFILNGIHNLGTSIDNPDDPIVPNHVSFNDQAIDIKGRILNWHHVESEVPVLK